MQPTSPRSRRWTRTEYDRLIDKGVIQPDERLEVLAGHLVVREPQGGSHILAVERLNVDRVLAVYRAPGLDAGAQYGWAYRVLLTLRAD